MAKPKGRTEKPVAAAQKSFWSSDRNIALILGLFAFVLYAQTIGFGYALDDVAVIHGNDYVKDGFGGFKEILSTYYWHGNASFTQSNSGLFRPLSLLMFATEWQLFGDKPAVFHFVHVVLYALLCAQLFLLLNSLLGKTYGKLALIATLLWIVLPVHTEVVANLKSADEILSLLFSVLGLRWLLKWNENRKLSMLLLSCGAFFLSLLSKEAAVLILPLALLMLMMFRGVTIRQLIFPGALLFGVALIWLGWHELVIRGADSTRIDYDYRHNALLSSASGFDQFGTALGLQARYWYKMLVGYPLSYNYSFNEIPVNGFADIWPWISLTGIGIAAWFAWKNFKTNPAVSFAIIFYFVTMLLTSNLLFKIGDIFAERFTFVPSVGFCLLVAFLILKMSRSQSTMSSSAMGVVVLLCLVYSIRTFARSSDWKDDSTLFLADVDHAPNSARVHDNVGVIRLNSALAEKDGIRKRQLFDLAYQEYSTAFGIDTLDFGAAQALGQILYHKADYKASVHWSQVSVQQRRRFLIQNNQPVTDDPTTFLNIGDAFIKLEQYDSANYYFQSALAIYPRTDIHMKIGDASLRARDTSAAIAAYLRAVELDPAFVQGWDKIGNLKGMKGDYSGSTEAFLKIAAIDSMNPNPWRMIYTNYQMMGDSVQMRAAADEYDKRGGK